MNILSVMLLAVAVSIDGLGVGLACGLGRVKIPAISLLFMGVASGSAVLISMLAGRLVGRFLNPSLTTWLGGTLLIVFGLWMLWQLKGSKKQGLMSLLDDPARADTDGSGGISVREAVVLGIALALDAFGAGFGAALAGFSPLATGISVAVAKVLLVGGGVKLGHLAAGYSWVMSLKVLPGLIICALGILKIFVF